MKIITTLTLLVSLTATLARAEATTEIHTADATRSFPHDFKPQGEAIVGLQSLQAQSLAIQEEHWSGLPFLGKQARERGYQLPIPIGFNVFYNKQEVGYVANNGFQIALGDLDLNIPSEDVIITGEDESIQLRADAWVLPFWNVYGLVGHTKGFKNIQVDLSNTQIGFIPGLDVQFTIPLEYKAYNVGLGTVLAGQVEVIPGMHPFIFTGVAAFTNSWTTATDSTIQTYIGSIRTGQRYSVPGGQLAVLVGYNYQLISQNVTGSVALGKLGLDYEVNLESKETKNMAVSMMYDFGPKQEWNLFLEYGFLNWDQLILSVGRRF